MAMNKIISPYFENGVFAGVRVCVGDEDFVIAGEEVITLANLILKNDVKIKKVDFTTNDIVVCVCVASRQYKSVHVLVPRCVAYQ